LPWIHTAYDVAIAAVVVWTTWPYGEEFDQLVGWAMALALMWRRKRPLTVMAVVSGLSLVQYLLSELPDELTSAPPRTTPPR